MATNPRKRQQKLERKAAKRKEKKHVAVRQQSLGLERRLSAASTSPPLYCWIPDVLYESGIGSVMFSRLLPDGTVAFALFLVDCYCLGVKDVVVDIVSRITFEDQYERRMRSEYAARDVSPATVRKLVEGAVAYAEDLGLHPHADYHRAKFLFGDVDPSESKEVFEFGMNGKPHFVAGPYDTPEKCRKVLGILTHRLGPDGFLFTMPFGDGERFLPGGNLRDSIRILVPEEDLDEIDDSLEDEDDED